MNQEVGQSLLTSLSAKHPDVRDIWQQVTERVQPGNEVPQFTVAMDQIEDAGGGPFQLRLSAIRHGRSAAGGAVQAKLKSGKECLPMIFNRSRVFLILLIKTVDVFCVGAIHEIESAVGETAPDESGNRVYDEPESIFPALHGRVQIAKAPGCVIEDVAESRELIVSVYRDLMLEVAQG